MSLNSVRILFSHRAQRTLKAAVENQNDIPSTIPYDKGNPFQQRPSSSRAASAAAANLERAMLELDSEQHMPENVEMETWKRLIMLRRTKVEKEQQVIKLWCHHLCTVDSL